MKKIAIFTILVFISSGLFAQTRAEKKAQREILKAQIAHKVDSLVNCKQLTFFARYASPAGQGDISLGMYYDLRIKDDTVSVYLPYFGTTYLVDYRNNDGGIKLIAPVQNYKVTFKKGNYDIKFDARGASDTYRMILRISQSGFCSLSVNCNNRQSISFTGILDQLGL
jgi:hypothetical protein